MDIETIGLHPAILLAGFAGGLCYVLSGKPTIREATSNLVVATLTTNYSYELGSRWLGAGTGIGLAAFATGVAAPLVIRSLIRRAAKYSNDGDGK
jgi:hypothetical protein